MSGFTVTPVAQDLFGALAPWLATITGLTAGTTVIQGLPNRTAMPVANPGFISMTFTGRRRLNTNIDSWDMESDDPSAWTVETHFDVVAQIEIMGVSAFDWCAMIESLWRDDLTCAALAPVCQPLYTDDPIQAPLDDSELQYEQRFVLRAHLQYNPVTTAPQDFASEAVVGLINVDERYPP